MPNDINSAPPVADAPAVDAPSPDMPIAPVPEAALALHLLDQARQAGAAPVLAILRSAPRLDRVAALAGAMACTAEGAVEALVLPPWDVLPYDRTLPSPGVIGLRIRALQALARPAAGPRLVLTCAAAALQRVLPARDLHPDPVLRLGDPVDPHGLALDLAARGYHAEERVDEPGTAALRGHVIEVFPAGGPCPIRMEAADGRIAVLHTFDPATQRSTGDADGLRLTPAIEFPLDPAGVEDAAEAMEAAAAHPDAEQPVPAPALPPRLGDLVVHEDHGVARLAGLRGVDGEERVALEFAEGAELLVPAWDLDRVWRLGGDRSPDRMGGDAWRRRRAEVEEEVRANATALAAAATARAAAKAPAIPTHPDAGTLARRFPHPLTSCQRNAIEAADTDMGLGCPMDRLVCGDVGFGKTEVAMRAVANAALAGWQVLVAAPTTVLARQHLDGFQRRFAGTGIEVAGLIRGAATPEGRAARRSVARGEARVVVGTHGLASDSVRFARLGMVVIDEEQRFGDDDKRRLAGLGGMATIVRTC